MTFDQIAIALLGALAAWLSQGRTDSARRWAPMFGMLGQPFWFYASWHAGQWGIFAVSVLYALAWMKGLWVYWISPRPAAGGARWSFRLRRDFDRLLPQQLSCRIGP